MNQISLPKLEQLLNGKNMNIKIRNQWPQSEEGIGILRLNLLFYW